MKVLYLHQYFCIPSQAGGLRSYEMAQQLIRHGHRVTMVCSERNFGMPPTNNNNITRGVVDGIDVIAIKVSDPVKKSLVKRAKSFLVFSWQCLKVAFREDYDIIFATSTPLTIGIPGIFAKLFRRKKFIFEVRDLWPELPKALGVTNPLWIWGMSVIEWLSYHAADGCIGLSPGICEGIKRRSQINKPIVMVPNGCDLDLFKPSLKSSIKLDGISDNDKVAIFTGAHGIANGLDAVLDAAKEVLVLGREDIKFVFIGSGIQKEHLQNRVKVEGIYNCLFYNPIPMIQLASITASATVGLMVLKNVPAFYYGTSPNKFFDYISSGLPVINNYPGWLADMIKENNCGIVVDPDNAKAFATALIDMIDKAPLSEYSNNARALAQCEFDRCLLGERFVSFFEKIYHS